jgi:LytR cell envelope-related transcriptional attenuator
VEHRHSLPAQQPWRSAALIAAVIAALELCLLLVLGFVLFGKYFAGEVERANDPVEVVKAAIAKRQHGTTPGTTGKPAKPLLSRGKTSVIVLNGNGIPGAAGATAERVRARRYVLAATGNAPRSDFPRSLVMYRPGFAAEARRLARDVGIKRVAPLDGLHARELQGAHLALIVGG